jgi:hypothetical protein
VEPVLPLGSADAWPTYARHWPPASRSVVIWRKDLPSAEPRSGEE